MITSLEIKKYIDTCVDNYKKNFKQDLEEDQDFDFLMFKYNPTFLYFENIYPNLKVTKEIASELMNMNELYRNRCQSYKLNSQTQ